MILKVDKSNPSGTIIAPPSKSYTHRALFVAALAQGTSVIKNALISRDTLATIDICRKLGAKIQIDEGNVIVGGAETVSFLDTKLNADNSGTTMRISMFLATLDLYKQMITIRGDESLSQRDMGSGMRALRKTGVECTSNWWCAPMTIRGRMKGDTVVIESEKSSQPITGALIASPLYSHGKTVGILGNAVSRPYIDATLVVMDKFGVSVEPITRYRRYVVPEQQYTNASFTVPGDFSGAAFSIAGSAMLGNNIVTKVQGSEMPQGDRAIISILEELGCEVTDNGGIKVWSPSEFSGGRFDLSNTPDLLPIVSVLALKSAGPIEIFNVKHAREKETDRIKVMARELRKFGLNVDERIDGMIIKKRGELKGAHLNSDRDHRALMALSIGGMYVGECTISDAEYVDVSYPKFVEDMKGLGANMELVEPQLVHRKN